MKRTIKNAGPPRPAAAPPLSPAEIACKSIPLLPIESGERIGLEEVGMVTDGTIDAWAERMVAIYRTMSSVMIAMDGIRCIPGDAEIPGFQEAHASLTNAMAMCGQMLLFRIEDTEAVKSLARYEARHAKREVTA